MQNISNVRRDHVTPIPPAQIPAGVPPPVAKLPDP